jgi:hypothetical protein
MRSRPPLILAAALLLGVAAGPPGRDPDWPCQSIRVPELVLGTMWEGPDLTAATASWTGDTAVADLVPRIAARRMPLDQAEAAIRDFAQGAGAARREELLRLAAGIFATLDAERAQVVGGLDRFGRRQKQLAAQIRADFAKLRTAPPAASGTATEGAGPLGDQLGWETRLFEQRRQAIATACVVPNRIEQRAYALLHTIAGLLG